MTMQPLSQAIRLTALSLGCASLCACLAQREQNMAPVAVVATVVDGNAIQVASLVPPGPAVISVTTSATTVMLDGSKSIDPEATPLTYAWWDTGVTAPTMPVQGPVDTSKLPEPVSTTASYSASIGTDGASYSLIVTDADGNVSMPATVRFVRP